MAVRGINKVILVGRLGKDPEVRYIPNGGAVANLQVATSESWRDKQTGEMREQTEWHRVVLFGKLAEVAGEYLRKGAQVYIEGQLRTRSWEDNGITRYVTEILVKTTGTMQMLGRAAGAHNRQYQAVRLDNGMVVLLVSDPQAVKSLSALVVPVGSLEDPEAYQGTVHCWRVGR